MDERDFEIELRGYNKEEVNMYITELEAEYKQKLSRLEARTRESEKQVDELTRRVEKKERQKEELEHEIETKYKTYIDHYDKIAGLVYESQLKADQILADANQRAEEILKDAHAKEAQILADAQKVMDDAKTQERLILSSRELFYDLAGPHLGIYTRTEYAHRCEFRDHRDGIHGHCTNGRCNTYSGGKQTTGKAVKQNCGNQ